MFTPSYWFGEFRSSVASTGQDSGAEPVLVGYTSNADNTQQAATLAKNGSSDSSPSNDITHDETDPLVVGGNQPYLDYGASGVPALRIENLSKVSS